MKPVCERCNDTHRMTLAREGDSDLTVQCTGCPVPCQKCRAGGRGAYCAELHCKCECHAPNRGLVPEDANSPTPQLLLMKELLELEARVTELRQRIGMSALDWDKLGDNMKYEIEETDLTLLLEGLRWCKMPLVPTEYGYVVRWDGPLGAYALLKYNEDRTLLNCEEALGEVARGEKVSVPELVATALMHHIRHCIVISVHQFGDGFQAVVGPHRMGYAEAVITPEYTTPGTALAKLGERLDKDLCNEAFENRTRRDAT